MEKQFALLPKIKSPFDIKRLNKKELDLLAQEIREQIVKTVSDNGGHLASNLGAVELSIALHRVFNSPDDKIIWDVGHQCYAHKLLTGRFDKFGTLRKQNGIAGFPKTSESPHDVFNTGHSSTSISAALGFLAADKHLSNYSKTKGNYAIAVIGDGALTGGLAYEALSHAGHLKLPLIVVLNDNKMSISPNVGGLSKYLSRLSMKTKYQTFRRHFDELTKKIPFIGKGIFNLIQRLKRAVKAVFYIDNFFVDLGFEYVGPIRGHNIQAIISVLEDVIKLQRPVVIHVITRKGKGHDNAEDDPDSYHGVGSLLTDGGLPGKNEKKFTDNFSKIMNSLAEKDKKVIGITAAMKSGTGLQEFAKIFPKQFFDVGIAEEHAVTFAAGLAAGGLKPVVAVYSTFVQRAVDQIIHDTALQKLPVIFALDRAGFVSADGETHQGLFDIALFRSAPNTCILSPASAEEMKLMFEFSMNNEQSKWQGRIISARTGPIIIRYPKAACPQEIPAFSEPLTIGRGVFVSRNNADVCLFFTGSLYQQVIEAEALLKENGIKADLYNLRFIKPIDESYLAGLMNQYKFAVFAEEGIKQGGFGEYAAALALQNKCPAKVLILAADSTFLENDKALGTREELLSINKLDGKGIAESVKIGYTIK